MEHWQWYDSLRVFNSILALISLYLVAKRFYRDKHTYTQRLLEFSWVLQAFLLLTFIGNLEQILDDVGWGYRTALTTILMLASLRASLRPEGLIKENTT